MDAIQIEEELFFPEARCVLGDGLVEKEFPELECKGGETEKLGMEMQA